MNRTILIAEDNADLLEVLSLQFDWHGYQVLRARDGVEALQQLERRPDLLLLDVAMPGKSGYEVCRSLKSDPARRDLPIILVSGRRGEIAREWGMECGADAFLTKPFGIAELEAHVDRLLARSRPSPDGAQAGSAAGAEPEEAHRVARWSFEPEAVRAYRQKYGELAYQRVLRELPEKLMERLRLWGVEGCSHRRDYGAVTLLIPAQRAAAGTCLQRLAAVGDDFLRSCYDTVDAGRQAVVAADPHHAGPEIRFPLLRLIPDPESEARREA